MFTFKQIRSLHKWPGILFLFPALLISITAILLALDGVLHMDRVKMNLPGMSEKYSESEIKSIVVSGENQYIGTKKGLFVIEGGQTRSIEELSGSDVRSFS